MMGQQRRAKAASSVDGSVPLVRARPQSTCYVCRRRLADFGGRAVSFSSVENECTPTDVEGDAEKTPVLLADHNVMRVEIRRLCLTILLLRQSAVFCFVL